jgi:hypothetical protein
VPEEVGEDAGLFNINIFVVLVPEEVGEDAGLVLWFDHWPLLVPEEVGEDAGLFNINIFVVLVPEEVGEDAGSRIDFVVGIGEERGICSPSAE